MVESHKKKNAIDKVGSLKGCVVRDLLVALHMGKLRGCGALYQCITDKII